MMANPRPPPAVTASRPDGCVQGLRVLRFPGLGFRVLGFLDFRV